MAVTHTTLAAVTNSFQFQDTVLANVAVTVKGSSATIYQLQVDNSANAAITYVKFFHSAGAIVIGTTVPEEVFAVPGLAIVNLHWVAGKAIPTGLQVAAVTAAAVAGATSPTSSTICRIIYV